MTQPRDTLAREYTIKNIECDFRSEIRPSALLGYFQEVAGAHAAQIGIGYDALRAQGFYWVLSKIYVQVLRRPRFEEEIRVETWPHAPNKAIFERSFLLTGSGGAEVRAFSRWCVLEGTRGRIVPCSRLSATLPSYRTDVSVPFDDWRIPEAGRGEPAYSLRVANSEYDQNYHVNNCRYADHVFNCFSVAELEARRLSAFQMNYVHQSHEGDVLDWYRRDLGGGVFAVEGVKNGAETVVAARVCFDA